MSDRKQYRIVLAKPQHLERVVWLATRFTQAAPWHDLFPPEVGALTKLARLVMGSGCIMLATATPDGNDAVGCLAMAVYPHPMTGVLFGESMFWYVEPECREAGVGLQLLACARDHASKSGAVMLKLAVPFGSPAGVVLEQKGYVPIEQAHVLVLATPQKAGNVALQSAVRTDQATRRLWPSRHGARPPVD